ncbi:MAG TPA: 2-oxoglutarate dehydrogenase E1 component, partial [Polyangia bacterium]
MSTDLLSLANNLPFVEEVYARYVKDPASVDASWRALFEGNGAAAIVTPEVKPELRIEKATNGNGNGAHAAVAVAEAAALQKILPFTAPESTAGLAPSEARYGRTFGLVNAHRARGHMIAQLDPLEQLHQELQPELDPRAYGFSQADLDAVMPSGGFYGTGQVPLRELMRRLRATYCEYIGVEMNHITDVGKRTWLQERMEPVLNAPPIDRDTQLYVLEKVAAAEVLESFIHTKYVGTKRFSLEGGESLIPMLELIVERAGLHGVDEIVLGMAHRGRLNVLVNVMGKTPAELFAEFEDIDPESMFGGGDVKYHLGYSTDRVTRTGTKMHLTMAFNPSHLEAVDPVVVGRVRAKQRRRKDQLRERVLGVMVHGDAAFAGQGLVAEVLNLTSLRGYRTGGTVHIIVNNQIGFTTSPLESRSTPYATDVAKGIQVPIFHVNGDHPESVAQVVRLAMDYRKQFHSDVVIDMYCYRKYGHNEADEPSFTQPLLYQKIEQHPSVRTLYARELVERQIIDKAAADAIVEREHQKLNDAFASKRSSRPRPAFGAGVWQGYRGGLDTATPEVATKVERAVLEEISTCITTLPDGFRPHRVVAKLMANRAAMGKGEAPLDWGMAEHLAFGSLVREGYMVRLSGQDSRRGTFSHRHAAVVDQRTGSEYVPLEHVAPNGGTQAPARIYDSPLSEAAVLGFEFGYSLDFPDALVAWEAQFGDFVNGAQVVIDQYISSAEDKWNRLSGLVVLLPHGYEGQGPEHSSARFERFLELAAEDNMQIVYPTTPAQFFHLLRRQVLRKLRKPLIVMTPKSLLRLPAARSELRELYEGSFQRILDDPTPPHRDSVRRVVLCTGKIYYELAEERARRKDATTALMRIEQLYPISARDLAGALDTYAQAEEVVWVQEEPANMGANHFIYVRLLEVAGHRSVHVVARSESASPATGSAQAHTIEQ